MIIIFFVNKMNTLFTYTGSCESLLYCHNKSDVQLTTEQTSSRTSKKKDNVSIIPSRGLLTKLLSLNGKKTVVGNHSQSKSGGV